MPDICMCFGEGQLLVNGGRICPKSTAPVIDCPKKETCFRFKATPSAFRQSYFAGLPYDPNTDSCKHFMPMTIKEAVEDLDGSVTEDVISLLEGPTS